MTKQKKIVILILIIIMTIYCMACAFLQNISIIYGVIFLIFQLFGILNVGYAIKTVLQLESRNWIEDMGISYVFGYASNILVYFIGFTFGKLMGLKIVFAIVVLVSLFYNVYIVKKRKINFYKEKNSLWVLLLFAVILGFQFFTFACNNCSTKFIGINSYYVDLIYWSSDAVMFLKQYPPINFRYLNGATYYYHYFSSIQLAVASTITGIPVINYALGFSFIQSAFLLVFGNYIFFNKILKEKFYVIIAIILSLFSTGYEYYTCVTIVSHLYPAPFGYDIGLVFGMITIYFFMCLIEQKYIKKNYLIATILCFLMCIGIKSPVAVIVLTILGCECFFLFLKGWKQNTTTLSVICVFLLWITFKFMFFFVVNGIPTGGGTKVEQFIKQGVQNTVLVTAEVSAVYESLINIFSTVLGEILFLLYYALLVNPAVFIVAIMGTIGFVLNLKKIQHFNISLLVGGIVGLVLTRFLKLDGFSQIYFVMAALPFIITYGVQGIECFIEKEQSHMLFIKKQYVTKGISIFTIVLGIAFFLQSYWFYPQLKSGVKKLLFAMEFHEDENIYLGVVNRKPSVIAITDEIRKNKNYIVIEDDEMEAVRWLRENSDEDSMILSALIETSNYQYNYAIGVIAERWIWMWDEAVIQNALNGDEKAVNVLRENNVRYVLIDVERDFMPSGATLEYSNDGVKIIDLFG